MIDATNMMIPEDKKIEDEEDDDSDNEGLHTTVVLVSVNDEFSLNQDICMCCGSFGKDSEGYLIGCVQCGQCFHPYCVNINVRYYHLLIRVLFRRNYHI